MFQISKVNYSPSFIDLQALKDTYESVWLTKSVGLHYKQLIKKNPLETLFLKLAEISKPSISWDAHLNNCISVIMTIE